MLFLVIIGIVVGGLFWLRNRDIGQITPLMQGTSSISLQSVKTLQDKELTPVEKARKAEIDQLRNVLPKDISATWNDGELKIYENQAAALRAKRVSSSTQTQ
ncbi:hypothetical protein KBC54_00410 [Patescibacteria group bacterium]|nr:hypothetical protein [Patescibacteria group bacterium]